MLGLNRHVGRTKRCLGGDAPDIEVVVAEVATLCDIRSLEAQLNCFDSGGEAIGVTFDDDIEVRCRSEVLALLILVACLVWRPPLRPLELPLSNPRVRRNFHPHP